MLVMDSQSITREEFFKLKEDNLMFITNPGRMGDEDGTTFIIKKGKKCIPYRIDGWMYGSKEDENYISIDEVFKVFPEWQNVWYNESIDDNGDTKKYKYIYMGFGNGLCVDKRIYDEFELYLKDACQKYAKEVGIDVDGPGVVFNAWYNAVLDMGIIDEKYLKEWKYEPTEYETKDSKEKAYTYVSVVYLDDIVARTTGQPSFYYKTEEEISIGDEVLVDRQGVIVEGRVVDVEYYTYDEVPFPLDRTKDIFEVIKENK